MNVRWIIRALKTVESRSLQHITIHPTPGDAIEEAVYQEWQDLDQLLVQFWITHSIRPRLVYKVRRFVGKDLRDYAAGLLPELTRRGLVDLVEHAKTVSV